MSIIVQLPVYDHHQMISLCDGRLRTKSENAFCHAGKHGMKGTHDHSLMKTDLTTKTSHKALENTFY